MTKTITRKSILLASFFLAMAGPIKAEIIYTDIADATLPEDGDLFAINFDGAGDPEFEMSVGFEGEPSVFFEADHSFMTVSADEWDVMRGLDVGTTIDAGGTWESFGDAYIDPFWGTTLFPNGADTYLGAQFKIGTNVHFGWVRVLWEDGILTIKDFAYDNTANAAINAGDTGDGGEGDILVTTLTITGEGGIETITVSEGVLAMTKTVLPADATDQTVTWSVTDMTGEATIDAAGNLTAVSNGTVLVKATTNDASDVEATVTITISNQVAGLNEMVVSKFHLYPNPANSVVNFSNIKGKQIELISLDGKVLYKTFLTLDTFTLDVSSFKHGAYLVRVSDENNGIMIEKLIIE